MLLRFSRTTRSSVLLPLTVVALVFVLPTLARGQTPPPRDPRPGAVVPVDEGSTIGGHVLALAGGQPLRQADVRLSGDPLREPLFVLTDEQGGYAFTGLAPGTYTVAAFRTGYVEWSYGQRRWNDLPAGIDLRAGEAATADLRLPRAGAIVVRLSSPTGEPIVGLLVQALAKRFTDGRPTFTVAGANTNAVTNDRGEARLFGLPEGEYYVVARPASLMPLQRPPREGETFYPGTRTSDRAMAVRVSAGSETAIALVVEPVARLSRVSGFIVDSSGSPATGATVSFTQRASARISSVRVDRFPDGRFVTEPLAPGEYALQVRTSGPAGQTEYGSARFQVEGGDIQGAVLGTRPGGVVAGRIVLDEPGLKSQSVRLQLTPVWMGERPMSTGIATVRDDWSFEIRDLMATGALRVQEPTGQWWIKSVRIDGREVSDVPVDFRAGTAFYNVQVVVTRRAAQVGGAVVGASDAVVVIFPTDPSLWTPTTRRIAVTSPDQTGQFVIGGLPSGHYHVVAVDAFQRGSERDVDTLRTMVGRSLDLHLAEGESKSVRLEVIER